MRICKLCRRNTFLVGGIELSVTDIIHHRSRKEINVLKHYAERTAKVALLYLVNVYSIVSYLTVVNIVETVDKVGYRRFTRSRSAYKGNLLTGSCVKRYIL